MKLSDDKAIAVIEPPEDISMVPTLYKKLFTEEYQEVLTTPNMIRKALDHFRGEEVIRLGVSNPHAEIFSAALIRIKNDEGKMVLLAGRGEKA